MNGKRIFLLPLLLLLLLLITGCDTDPAQPPAAAPAESDAPPTTAAYPPPEQSASPAAVEAAYPPESSLHAGNPPPAYPPPAAEPYPAPDAAYPAPQGAPVEAAAGQEENTLLPETNGDATLTNRVWTLQQFNDQTGAALLPPPLVSESNTIQFFEDGRVSIIAGCNVARGAYAAEDGVINIQAANQTQEACEPDSMGNQFLHWLNEAGTFELSGGSLALLLPADAGTVQFTGSEILTYGDIWTQFMVHAAGQGVPQAQPQTLEELMDASLEKLVYQEGDVPNLAYGEAPGAVVLIESPQGSMVKATGLADVEANKPMSAFDRLEIGSNTKMFTGVLLAQLQEEGILSLNDPLSKWLPEMAAVVPNGEAMMLRHLATHTAGIADYADAVIGSGASDSEALRSAYTPQELVMIAIEDNPPDFAPGEPGQWKYSNTGYILLGMVLEAAAGQTYADLLQQRIFDPLQMDHSELLQGAPVEGSITDGYFLFPYEINTTEWNGTQGWSAGAIISTAADMAKFARGLMTGALFQDPATLDVMTDFIDVADNEAVGSVGGTGYGNGLIEFAPGLWGHRGQTIGFTSIVAMDPQNDFILIALTNSAEGAVAAEQDLIGYYLHPAQ